MEWLDNLREKLSGFGNASGGSEEDHLDYSNPDNLAAETAVTAPLDFAENEEDVAVGVSEVKPPVDYPIPDEDEPHFV